MKYHIHISEDAELDIRAAMEWYNLKRPLLGNEFLLSLEAALSRIQRNPTHFQFRYKSYQIAFLARFPYGVHFLVEDTNVYVNAVFHMSRSPKNWDDRTTNE